MKLNDFFDKIFVINLERRPDRLEIFKQISNDLDFEFEVFKAYDGREIDDNFVYNGKPINIKPNKHYKGGLDNYSRGALGCLLSHLDIIKKSKYLGYKKVLILEDDVEFNTDFKQRFNNFISNFDKDWDMIYFSGSLLETSEDYEYCKKLISCHTTHSYAVCESIYEYLIENIEKNLYISPIDETYSIVQSNIKSFITIPFLTYQSGGFSDIQNSYVDYDSIKKYL